MKISSLIEQLQDIQESQGDIEVVMTATMLPEGFYKDKELEEHMRGSSTDMSDVFVSTVETLRVEYCSNIIELENSTKCVKLYWQA